MKRIGILGGSSDQATADYYRRLNAAVNARLGGWNTAELLINSMNFAFVTDCIRSERWDDVAAYLAERSRALEQAGCDLLLCVSNTLHRVAPVFTAGLKIPFLHIADPTAAAIKARGLDHIALFGTRPVMATDFMTGYYRAKFGIDILVPSPAEQDTIDRIIFDELCKGAFLDGSRRTYLDIAARMHHAGAEGLILGCTEIPLLIGQKDMPNFPMLDTVALHVEAAVNFALAYQASDGTSPA
jgi:aspartate racemase